jgi:hypothetical protein
MVVPILCVAAGDHVDGLYRALVLKITGLFTGKMHC